MRKEKVRVVTVYREEYDGAWPFGHASDLGCVIGWLNDTWSAIPAEFRKNAFITVTSEMQWDSSRAVMEIGYQRPITGEEEAKLEHDAKLRKEQEIIRARAILARHGL